MDNMLEQAEDAADFLKGMANAHRLSVLCHLVDGEKSVTDLIALTGIAQTSMSQHLSKLKAAGLVSFRRDHRTLYYKISEHDVMKVMGILYERFCGNAKHKNKKGL